MPLSEGSASGFALWQQHRKDHTIFNVALVPDPDKPAQAVRVAAIDLARVSDWYWAMCDNR